MVAAPVAVHRAVVETHVRSACRFGRGIVVNSKPKGQLYISSGGVRAEGVAAGLDSNHPDGHTRSRNPGRISRLFDDSLRWPLVESISPESFLGNFWQDPEACAVSGEQRVTVLTTAAVSDRERGVARHVLNQHVLGRPADLPPSRVGQHAAIGMATEHSVTTRPSDRVDRNAIVAGVDDRVAEHHPRAAAAEQQLCQSPAGQDRMRTLQLRTAGPALSFVKTNWTGVIGARNGALKLYAEYRLWWWPLSTCSITRG